MIQRIQTVFLLLALLCMVLLYFFPYGTVINKETKEVIDFSILGTSYFHEAETKFFSNLPTSIMVTIVCAVSFVSIFLFKKRMIQIRLSFFNMVLQLGSAGMMYYFIYNANKVFGEDFSVNVLIVFPLAAMIFTFLAIRNIAKDEALVRSINRIR